jgi:ferredoxin
VTISRRDLFRVFRSPDQAVSAEDASTAEAARAMPAEPAPVVPAVTSEFSLEAFYAARAPAELPAFTVAVPEHATPTTRIGLGRTTGLDRADASAGATSGGARGAGATPIAPTLVPRVLPHRCLATTSFCSVCVERCPIEGAIVVTLGRPQVEAHRCDGCGKCIAACPAPILAFELRARDGANR